MKQWIEKRTCEVCQKEFLAKLPGAAKQTTCSRKCRYQKYRKNWSPEREEKQRRRTKDLALRRTYGIGLEKYEEMLEKQGGCCFICREFPSSKKVLCVDHDHQTGKVRKLLCERCNFGLGSFNDDVEKMKLAIEYIESHRASDFTPE